MNKKFSAIFFLINITILFLWSLKTYSLNINWLFPGGDGSLLLSIMKEQYQFGLFSIGMAGNPLQGLGDMDFPINTWLIPSFLTPSFIYGYAAVGSPEFQVLWYSLANLQLFFSIYLFARSIDFDELVSSCSGWVSVFLLMPIVGLPIAYPLITFAPNFANTVSLTFLVIACLFQYRKTHKYKILYSLAVLILLIYLVITSPLSLVLFGPLLFFGIFVSLWQEQHCDQVHFFKYIGIPFLALLFCGIGFYIFGLMGYSAGFFYGNELETNKVFKDWKFVSHIYHNVFFYPIFLFSTIGLIFFYFKSSKFQVIPIGVISLISINFALGYLIVQTNYYKGPAPIYFEVLYLPIIIIYSIFGLLSVIFYIYKSRGAFQLSLGNTAIYSGILGATLFFIVNTGNYSTPNNSRIWGPYPYKEPGLIKYLIDHVQIKVNSIFRGRVATFLILEESKSVDWLDIVGKYNKSVLAEGNDFYWSGLWDHDIPTLFKYSPTMSPLYYVYMTRLLGINGDRLERNIVILRNPKLNILASLGVKFVITDKELTPPFFKVFTQHLSNNNDLFLYEIKNSNNGTYSPTKIIVQDSLMKSVDYMLNSDTDYSKSIILVNNQNVTDNLTSAFNVEFKIIKGGYSLKASSNGFSSILLPIEYSECLSFKNNSPFDKFVIKQANIIQTAIFFEKNLEVEFTYATGPFFNSTCRIKDILNFKKFNY